MGAIASQRRSSKKTSELRITGLCVGNSPGTGEFPAQMASNVENGSIWWRHHVIDGRERAHMHYLFGIRLPSVRCQVIIWTNADLKV